ncbi:hypothetical protein IC3_00270 [Bacillus cereus VD142]|nr:hypothetical protein IC3_00270 [Bacillus cereus VD142]
MSKKKIYGNVMLQILQECSLKIMFSGNIMVQIVADL